MAEQTKCPCGCALIEPRHDSRDTAAIARTVWKRLEPTLWKKPAKPRRRKPAAVLSEAA